METACLVISAPSIRAARFSFAFLGGLEGCLIAIIHLLSSPSLFSKEQNPPSA
jgi:hypothetical protein